MKVTHIRCGQFVNASEQVAVETLEARLSNAKGEDEWVLLSNLAFSAGPARLGDDIDILAIGPTGVHVVEVKHWDRTYLKVDTNKAIADKEALKLNDKAKRVAGKLRNSLSFNVGFVAGRLFLTRSETETYLDESSRRQFAGIEIFGLREWKDLLRFDGKAILSSAQVRLVCKTVEPRAAVNLSQSLRTFGDFFDLQPLPGSSERFRRAFRARRRPTGDKVVLHLYDLSASKEKKALEVARREFDILQKLQKSQWLPNLMDSFQEATAYPGEIYFFSYVDPEAAALCQRAQDSSWTVSERTYAAERCLQALKEVHGDPNSPILHRNLTPDTIRVRSSNEPLLTNLQFARITDAETLTGSVDPRFEEREPYVAPEVLMSGLGACSVESDIYSLCASLSVLFAGKEEDPGAVTALNNLARGLAKESSQRATLDELLTGLATPSKTAAPPSKDVPVAYWDEDTIKEFRGRHYRIVSKLGSGSVGTTFKVVEVSSDADRKELSGPYVAKVITNTEAGAQATLAYAKVRAQTGGPCLAGILEVANEWKPGEITALLRWVSGDPLNEWKGALPLYLDEVQTGEGREQLLLRWVRDLCDGLSQLHGTGLVHGDVSPKNIIVHGGDVTLTDFDLAASTGSRPIGGTPHYCCLEVEQRLNICPADDVFALAASLFDAVFDRFPFVYGTKTDKTVGLNWEGTDRNEYPRLAEFMDKATHRDRSMRFLSAHDAIAAVDFILSGATSLIETIPKEPETSRSQLSDNQVPWLKQAMQLYPASPQGNTETRGLDSPFARQTYVETPLDSVLATEILNRKVSLVILCGNAGDGKTAFLQYLATKLGIEARSSADRIWDCTLANGLRVRANLDGAAAYQGRSAKNLLDEFFAPFQTGINSTELVHLVAINDGPLIEWLTSFDEGTWLTAQLWAALDQEAAELDSRLRFIDLNARSLVGGCQEGQSSVDASFMYLLIEKTLGDEKDEWQACTSCTAQGRCTAWQSVRAMRNQDTGYSIRRQLIRALQAVHQRGEVHITARTLRASLGYIFFGTHYCTDLHANPNLRPSAYWDRSFGVDPTKNQVDVLAELQLFDPALESNPRIDRYLLSSPDSPDRGNDCSPEERLRSLRRWAYFEWSIDKIKSLGGSETALDLARGKHLVAFMEAGTGSQPRRREEICSALCQGIARLEDLPQEAFVNEDCVPLRITPRTPTETRFWVLRNRRRFSLTAHHPRVTPGLDTLHTHVVLSYRFESGHEEELIIGAELFHLLMELKEGYQISDIRSDDIFANLSIFKQRLVQEEDRTLYAWNPLDLRVFRVSVETLEGIQRTTINPVFGDSTP